MRHWLRSYGLLLRWNLLRLRTLLPVLLSIQILMSIGIVLGFAFLIPDHNQVTVLYLSTGAPTVSLIVIGMVLVPQMVAQQKARGLFDYQRALPVPRLAMLAADATVWIPVALPGLVLALVTAALRFDLDFTVSPLVVPAILLVALVTVALGYGIGYAASPETANIGTNLIIIIALMFSPINYPAERLPDWLAAVHQWLPFQYMAQAIRDTVDVPPGGVPWLPFAYLAAWGLIGLTATYHIMSRRA
jgi:ABC-2 type transport system permease protein